MLLTGADQGIFKRVCVERGEEERGGGGRAVAQLSGAEEILQQKIGI